MTHIKNLNEVAPLCKSPHSNAAFINMLREEGTKEECCDWLQVTWNDLAEAYRKIRELEFRMDGLEK